MALNGSGNLSMSSGAAGVNISLELYGSSQAGSLNQFLTDANKTSPGSMRSFLSFNGTPDNVSSLTATEVGGPSVDVTWTNGTLADNHLQTDIYRDVNGGGFSLYSANQTSPFNDSSVSGGSSYTYRVRTRTKAGRFVEDDSNQVTIGA